MVWLCQSKETQERRFFGLYCSHFSKKDACSVIKPLNDGYEGEKDEG